MKHNRSKGGHVQQPTGAPRTELATITPAMATKWLATTKRNRSLSLTTVKAYAADMRAGAWKITHQGIGFNVDGELVDGQHRLSAVVEADIPVTMPVTHNLPRDAQDVIDAPRVRTVKDQLELIDGVTNSMTKAAIVKIIWALENTGHTTRSLPKLTLHQTREGLAKDGERIDRMLSITTNTALKLAPYMGALAFAMGAGERVAEFAEAMRHGEGLKRGMPVHTLREYILLNRHGTSTQARIEVAFCALRAVYAHIHSEELRVLRPTQLIGSPLMEEIVSFFRLANETSRAR